jgi:hypothetical protein
VILFANLWGTNGVAIAADIMMLTGVALLIHVSRRFIQYSLLRIWLFPSVAALLACTAGYYFPRQLPISTAGLLLVSKTGFMLTAYIVSLIIFEHKDIRRYGLSSIKTYLEGLKFFNYK